MNVFIVRIFYIKRGVTLEGCKVIRISEVTEESVRIRLVESKAWERKKVEKNRFSSMLH